MSQVLFARPRHHYDSYQDLYRLIELSGYPLVYFDELDPASDNCYVLTVLNGQNEAGWPGARATIVLFDLEWHISADSVAQYNTNVWKPGFRRVWAADPWYARAIGAEYVPLGSHPGLALEPIHRNGSYRYDVATMCYYTHRRQCVYDELTRASLRVAPNGWGYERHQALTSSRAMLHMHQHDGIATCAPQRFALAAAYELPLITETLAEWGIFRHSHLLSSDYAHLATFTQMWTRRNEAQILENFGRALHQLLCVEKTFRACVEGAV